MPSAIDTAISAINNAPLPLLIEKLGMAIAEAQSALDQNSIVMANELAQTEMTMPNGKTYNLLAVGFKPTFYSFTEASIEASMEFYLAESESFGFDIDLPIGQGSTDADSGKKESKMFAANISAYYASKFEASAKGSSSIMARLISLPAPDRYQEILQELANGGESTST